MKSKDFKSKKMFVSHDDFQKFPSGLIDWAARNNKRLVINEDGLDYEDLDGPIDWSAYIAYGIIGLGVLFAAYCYFFKW